MTKSSKTISAVILAFTLGLMSLISGSRVLLGYSQPDWIVLTWLVIYNVVLGIFSIGTSFIIWLQLQYAIKFVLGILTSHILVLLILIAIFFSGGSVATNSVLAMAFRVAVWSIILLVFGKKIHK